MPNAISYIRFSSAIQGEGSSTERQEGLINEWLAANPAYTLSDLSAKDLGRSGYKGEHLKHGLGEIVNAIEEKKIRPGDVLLVEALDRLGRLGTLDMINLIQRIISAGIKIITLHDKQIYDNKELDGLNGQIYLLVGKIQQAREYSKNLSDRILAAYKSKRIKAREGRNILITTPKWLNTDGTLKPMESEAVRKCIDMYLRGYGSRQIILELLDKYPFLENVHPSTLPRWFKNKALIGIWENKGDPIEGVFEPLVDDSIFYALQGQIDSRYKYMSPEQKYTLSGLVKCGICGSSFHFRRKVCEDYVIVYANCSNYLKRGSKYCKNNKTWPYEVLEYIYKDTYVPWINSLSRKKVDSRKLDELHVLESKEDECKKNIETLLDLLINMPGQIQIQDRLYVLNKKLEELRAKSNEIKREMRGDISSSELTRLRIAMKREELIDDEIALRDSLRKLDYKISIDASIASVPEIEEESLKSKPILRDADQVNVVRKFVSKRYELKCRRQKFGCYFLRKIESTGKQSSPSNGEQNIFEFKESYVAVFRNKMPVESQTESSLLSQLSQTN